jgi:hypothetical protein
MDVLWCILRIISIPRPYYTSEELAVVCVPHENYPPVSGYRILVSMVVIAFGIGKAACGYVGLSTAANYIDWTFAVVVTSMFVLFPPLTLQRNSDLCDKSFYVLGLYENNTVEFLPAFFVTDYTHTLQNGTYQGAHHCLPSDAFLSPSVRVYLLALCPGIIHLWSVDKLLVANPHKFSVQTLYLGQANQVGLRRDTQPVRQSHDDICTSYHRCPWYHSNSYTTLGYWPSSPTHPNLHQGRATTVLIRPRNSNFSPVFSGVHTKHISQSSYHYT